MLTLKRGLTIAGNAKKACHYHWKISSVNSAETELRLQLLQASCPSFMICLPPSQSHDVAILLSSSRPPFTTPSDVTSRDLVLARARRRLAAAVNIGATAPVGARLGLPVLSGELPEAGSWLAGQVHQGSTQPLVCSLLLLRSQASELEPAWEESLALILPVLTSLSLLFLQA